MKAIHGICHLASLPTGSGRAGALSPDVGVRVEVKTAPGALEQFDALTSPDMQPKPMTFADVAECLEQQAINKGLDII